MHKCLDAYAYALSTFMDTITDPVVITDDGSTWTHIINIEELALRHNRTVSQLMAYLQVALMSMGTYENRIYGDYDAPIIKAALYTLAVLDLIHAPHVEQMQQQLQQQQIHQLFSN